VHAAHVIEPVVLDVSRPGLAPYVDDDAVSQLGKLDHDEGCPVALLVLIRVVVLWETLCRPVDQWSYVLLIDGILPFTSDTDVPC